MADQHATAHRGGERQVNSEPVNEMVARLSDALEAARLIAEKLRILERLRDWHRVIKHAAAAFRRVGDQDSTASPPQTRVRLTSSAFSPRERATSSFAHGLRVQRVEDDRQGADGVSRVPSKRARGALLGQSVSDDSELATIGKCGQFAQHVEPRFTQELDLVVALTSVSLDRAALEREVEAFGSHVP